MNVNKTETELVEEDQKKYEGLFKMFLMRSLIFRRSYYNFDIKLDPKRLPK